MSRARSLSAPPSLAGGPKTSIFDTGGTRKRSGAVIGIPPQIGRPRSNAFASRSEMLSRFQDVEIKPRQSLSAVRPRSKSANDASKLSEVIGKDYDAFKTDGDGSGGDGGDSSSPIPNSAGAKKAVGDRELSPIQRLFDKHDDERASRQQAFVNKYMPGVNKVSKFQAALEKKARSFLGIKAPPKKTSATEDRVEAFSEENAPDKQKDNDKALSKPEASLGQVQRSAYERLFDKDDPARAERQKAFVNTFMPHLGAVAKLQDSLESKARSILGIKAPETAGLEAAEHKPSDEKAPTSGYKTPMERLLGNDPERAQRKQEFLNKKMPHIAGLAKLQSGLESLVQGAIKGPLNNADRNTQNSPGTRGSKG